MIISAIWYAILVLLGISLIICVHELGHFLVAYWSGIKILRFSIGFGKPFWRAKTKSGIEFAIAPFLLGGYVKLLDEREGEVSQTDLYRAFNRQSIVKRAFVLLAGPLANFILAVILFWVCYSVGFMQLKPIIESTIPGTISSQAQLPANSQITQVGSISVSSWMDVIIELFDSFGSNSKLFIAVNNQNKNEIYQLSTDEWTLDELRPDPLSSLGIIPQIPSPQELKDKPDLYLQSIHYPVNRSLLFAFHKTWQYLHFNFAMIYKLLTGVISLKSLTGPIGVLHGIKIAANQGIINYLHMLAVLSIAIGFINLFPLPSLDGGHMLFLLLEALRGKPLSVAVQVLFFRLGIIVLAMLMVQAIINDLLRAAIS